MMRSAKFRSAMTGLAAVVVLTPLVGCGADGSASRARGAAEQRWRLAQADVKARLAADQLEVGNIRQAANELTEARRLAPEESGLKVLEARVLLADGRFGQAERVLNSVERDSARDPEVHYLLGVIEQQRLRWEAALECYLAAMREDPQQVDYVSAAVQVLLQLGRASDGLKLLTECKDRFGWQAAWHAARAECFEQLDKWDQAASEWQRVTRSGEHSDVSERLALALFHAEKWQDAIPVLRGIVEADPSPATYSLRLALAECLLESGDGEESREQVLAVLEHSPRNVPALHLLVRILAAEGHYERGLAVAEQVLDMDRDDMQAAEFAAALAYKVGDRPRAVRWARMLVEEHPSEHNPIAARILGKQQ